MFNLILKDILIQKKTILFGAVYVIFMILAFQTVGSLMAPIVVGALTYMMVQTACAYDDKNKTDIFLNSLPIGRNNVVLSRYLSVFVFAVIGIIYYIVITNIIKLAGLPIKVHPISFEGIFGAWVAIVLLNSIYFPIFFKLGYIKARMIHFILFFGTFFGISSIGYLFVKSTDNEFIQRVIGFLSKRSDLEITVGLVVLMILFMTISYLISLKFYRKREF